MSLDVDLRNFDLDLGDLYLSLGAFALSLGAFSLTLGAFDLALYPFWIGKRDMQRSYLIFNNKIIIILGSIFEVDSH